MELVDAVAVPAGARCGTHPASAALYLCARCGTFLCTDCAAIGFDGESYCGPCEAHLPGDIPWEQRRRIGYFGALRDTVAAVLLWPAAFFRHAPRERSIWPALVFGYLFTALVDAIDLLRAIVVWSEAPEARVAFVEGFERGASEVPALAGWGEVAWFLVELGGPVASPLTYGVWMIATAAAWWVGLRVVSGSADPREILRGLSYTNVLALFGVVTLFLAGPVAVFVMMLLALWGGVLQVLAMARLTDGSIGRSVAAFVISIVLLSLAGCAICMVPAAVVSVGRL